MVQDSETWYLLFFVPIGIAAGFLEWNPTTVFLFNILAIIPLATCLSRATEDLAAEAGHVVGALLNATFGNAAKMIVSHENPLHYTF